MRTSIAVSVLVALALACVVTEASVLGIDLSNEFIKVGILSSFTPRRLFIKYLCCIYDVECHLYL